MSRRPPVFAQAEPAFYIIIFSTYVRTAESQQAQWYYFGVVSNDLRVECETSSDLV